MHKSARIRFGSIAARPPHAEAGQRIGLLGGSFNPPHSAHRLVSEIALRRLRLDQVWWMVTPGNPLKAGRQLAPLEERLQRSRAVAADPRIVITSFEAALGTGYTAASLGFLRTRLPMVRFVWLMGADCLAEFHRWQQWRDIFAMMPVAVIDRPGWRLPALASKAALAFRRARWPESRAARLAEAAPPAWTLLTGPLSEISSTELRAAARLG